MSRIKESNPCRPLMIHVAGGGPVGLSFAIAVRSMLGEKVRVKLWDSRWTRVNGEVVWKGSDEGNNRRRQVVTLQSAVWANLPKAVQAALFVDGGFTEMWPNGPDSPDTTGRPRNIRVCWFEDCMLDLARKDHGIELTPGAYIARQDRQGVDILAICDGPRSKTRQAIGNPFGTPSVELYSIDQTHLVETVLGLEVWSDLQDESTVPLTVCQNRFLFNPLAIKSEGRIRGFINMRLTPEEANEVVGITREGPAECIQRHPCVMRSGPAGLECGSHGSVFKPSVDPTSFLWPRIQDGLRYFGVPMQDLISVTAFRLGMEQTPRFTAQLSATTFAFLLGDAGNALHFWPGRGLNTGLKSAQSLARNLSEMWTGRGFRMADFTRHEGVMQQLQFREKSRAWATMVMADEHGVPRPIHERIRAGLKGPFDRAMCKQILLDRIRTIADRLRDRMGSLPDASWYEQRLAGLDDRTLKVLVETGPWITSQVGGEEVSVDAFFPLDPDQGA